MAHNSKKIRVLHAPRDIGGNAYYLARGEGACGFQSKNMVYFKQWYGYDADIDLKMRVDDNPVYYLRWWWTMLKVALSYDVLHFNFGGSFLSYYPCRWIFVDLPLWRSLGLATFVTFQGCEGRIMRYVMGHRETPFCAKCRSLDFCSQGYDDFKLESIAQAGRYFDRIFAVNPDLLHNIPHGQFLPYANCDPEEWKIPSDFNWKHSGPVRILHAPTNREIKGTEAIIAAVESLKAEGRKVELILVENVPHKEVKILYSTADLLVDQILIGWYGGLAVELMALGKPVIAYIRSKDLQFIPSAMRNDLPIISADVKSLRDVLRPLVEDPELRKKIGEKSRAFVEKWHDPRVVGQMTTQAYLRALKKRPPVQGAFERVKIMAQKIRPPLGVFSTILRTHWFPFVMMRRLHRKNAC